jgi:hypothetical protein
MAFSNKKQWVRLSTRVILAVLVLAAAVSLGADVVVSLSPTASPSSGGPGTIESVTGSNFPAGTILPSQVIITLQPSVAGAGPTLDTTATNVVTIIGSTRKVYWVNPAGLVVAAPTTYWASMTGPGFTSNKTTFTANPAFKITDVTPKLLNAGQSAPVNVTTAFGTNVQGVTKASLGAGVSVGGAAAGAAGPVTVINASSFTANVSVDAGAASGARTLTVFNGATQASLAAALVINRAPVVNAGADQNITLPANASLTGSVNDDGFPQGAAVTSEWTKVSGPGTVGFGNASLASTTATFSAPGFYTLRLTGNDTQLNGSDDINITVNAAPTLISIIPNTGTQGQNNVFANIVGDATHFVNGTTVAGLGAGITVVGTTVTDATHALVQLNIAADAPTGAHDLTMTTGGEVVTLVDAFTVNATSSGQISSVRLKVSSNLVAPGGAVTFTVEALDANQNPVINPVPQFDLNIAAVGSSFGNAPVIQGNTITFPKLVKAKLANQNPDFDPNGDFVDDDPNDPNYGKQTGGLFNFTATLQGTAIKATEVINCLPTGTADITVATHDYAAEAESAFRDLAAALNSSDTNAYNAAKAKLQALQNKVDIFSFDVLNTNQVLAPPNGKRVTVAQLIAAGIPAAADDAAFGPNLTALHNALIQAINRLALINPAAIVQADITAMQGILATYQAALAQLKTLHPGPRGITGQDAILNQIIRFDIPRLADAAVKLGVGMTDQISTPLARRNGAPPTLASERMLARAGIARFQLFSFFSTMFSVLTDLKGTAKGNIIELAISLANDILNLELANIINSQADGGLGIDWVQASASVSFVCPNYSQTFVDGTGFDASAAQMKVATLGCIDSQLLRNLGTLSKPKDLAGAIRLLNKVVSISKALARDQGVAAVNVPDLVCLGCGLFDDDHMEFHSGWPRVNQGRLPCVGVIIVFNMNTGSFAATNSDFLGSCGL